MRGDDAYNILNKKIKNQSERIKETVNEYLKENPVQSGATEEQAQQIKQNTDDVASLKEDLSNKITKFYASNQGETHLADSDNGKIQDMMVYGKSEQKQYSGKNLFDKSTSKSAWISDGGIYLEKGEIGENTDVVSTYIGVKENSTYIASFKTNYNTALVYWCTYNANKEFASTIKNANKITIPTGIRYVRVMISLPQQYCVAVNDELQVELGTEATAYEPYTGGQPSPSPDYPQEIKSVVNPTVKVCGKNLLNPTLQTTTVNGVTCTANGDGTYTLNGTATSRTELWVIGGYNNNIKIPLNPTKKYVLKGTGYSHIQMHIGTASNTIVSGDGKDITLTNRVGLAFVLLRIESGFTANNLIIYPQLEEGFTPTTYEPYHEQTVTLPYTLNAIPVSSGGNVTIDGQQYVSDYFDVERGKLVRMCKEIEKVTSDLLKALSFSSSNESVKYAICNGTLEIKEANNSANVCYALCSHFKPIGWYSGDSGTIGVNIVNGEMRFYFGKNSLIATLESAKQFFEDNEVYISGVVKVPKEIDLTHEEIAAFKALATYYPITNISINSEQLDGYTVFNYPISMENGWNYVKQQIGDTREYIYDIDARTQDTDLQAAEAYVNSEYAVALTELEV